MENNVLDLVKEVLDAVGITYSDITEESVAGQAVFQIITDDKALSGPLGNDIVRAFDHLIKRISEQRGFERANFLIDINQQQMKRIKELEMKAKMMAERARSFQYDVELAPMSPYERLLVHSILGEVSGVKTESMGEGRDRHIVIRYVEEAVPISEEIL